MKKPRQLRLKPFPTKPPPPSVEDLVQLARGDVTPTLASPMDAAFQPGAIWRRWVRHVNADGDRRGPWSLALTGFMAQAAAGFVMGGILTAVFFLMGIDVLVAGPTSFLLGGGAAWWLASGKMFKKVYGILYVHQNPFTYAPWQSHQMMPIRTPRLIFALRQDEVCFGSYDNGYMRVQTSDMDISESVSQKQFYDLEAGSWQAQEGPMADAFT